MIITTDNKSIPKGFLLHKDYLLSKLFLSKNKKPTSIQMLNFQSSPIETSLYLQITKKSQRNNNNDILRQRAEEGEGKDKEKTRNLKSISVMSNIRNRSRLRKAFLPNFSSIDFHQHYRTKGEFVLKFMEDDLNITSIHSKKFYYTNRSHHYKDKGVDRIKDNGEQIGGSSAMLGKTAIIGQSSMPKINYAVFSNDKLKHIKSRPVTGMSWFQTELPNRAKR